MSNDRTTARALLLVALVALAAPTVGGAVAAQENPPSTPAAYYGQALVDGEPAPAGVTVAAVVDGETVATIETGEDGSFGGAGAFAEKLTVPAPEGGNGTTVSFTVGGERADETVEWVSGDVREITLSVDEIATPVPTPTPADPDPTPTPEPEPEPDPDPDPDPDPESTATPPANESAASDAQPEVVEKATINDTDPDTPGVTVAFNRTKQVREVTFNNENVTGNVEVSEYNETPEDVQRNISETFSGGTDTDDGGTAGGNATVVSVVDISPDDPDTASSSATIELTVDRSDVENPSNVFVAHEQADGTWERLPTNVTESNEGTVTVRAKTNSFSRFAVVEQQQSETPTATATPEPTPTATATSESTQTPTEAVTDTSTPTEPDGDDDSGGLGPLAIAGGLAVVLALAGLLLRRRGDL